jgi:ribose 5-phosphate isomerase A
LVKGGGGAHTREKLVAAAAEVFVVIADSTKLVATLRPPIPLEVLAFGVDSTLDRIGTVRRREAPLTPDGGVLADFIGDFEDPAALAQELEGEPGVLAHGLFPPVMVRTVLIGRKEGVERIDLP